MNCNTCAEVLMRMEDLTQHANNEKHMNTEPNSFSCIACSITFLSLSDAVLHIKSEEHSIMILSTGMHFQSENNSSVDLFPPLYCCVLCSFRGLDYTSYMTHLNGSSHGNIARLMKALVKKRIKNYESIDDSNGKLCDASPLSSCELCNSFFSSSIYESHVKSTIHIEAEGFMNKINNLKQIEFFGATQSFEDFSNSSLLPHVCELCNIHFNEVGCYESHLKTPTHENMEKLMIKLIKIRGSNVIGGSFDRKSRATFSSCLLPLHYCKECYLWLSKVKYLRHVNSDSHRRIEEFVSLLSCKEIEDGEVSPDEFESDNQFKPPPNYCKLCAEWCSDTKTYERHLEDLKHTTIANFLNRLPSRYEKRLVEIFLIQQAYKKFNNPPPLNYCNICNILFTNSEKYKDHLKSDAHKASEYSYLKEKPNLNSNKRHERSDETCLKRFAENKEQLENSEKLSLCEKQCEKRQEVSKKLCLKEPSTIEKLREEPAASDKQQEGTCEKECTACEKQHEVSEEFCINEPAASNKRQEGTCEKERAAYEKQHEVSEELCIQEPAASNKRYEKSDESSKEITKSEKQQEFLKESRTKACESVRRKDYSRGRRKHSFKITSVKKINCDRCAEMLAGMEDLTEHSAKENHRNKNSHSFSCMPCSKTFQSIPDVSSHFESEEHSIMILATDTVFDSENKNPDCFNDSFPPLYCCILCSFRSIHYASYAVHMKSSVHKTIARLMEAILKKQLKNYKRFEVTAYGYMWDTPLPMSTCKLCNLSFSLSCFKSHVKSKDHIEAERFINKINNLKQIVLFDEFPDDSSFQPLVCDLCNIYFIEFECYEQHIRNPTHKRMQCLLMKIVNVRGPSVIGGSVDENARETFSNSLPPLYYCDFCNFWLSKVENTQHSKNNTHRRIDELVNILCDEEDGEINLEREISECDGGLKPPPNYCKLCSEWCCDITAYDIHLEDMKHIIIEHFVNSLPEEDEKLINAHVDVEAYQKFNNPPPPNYCNICNVLYSNSEQFKSHLESDKHKESENNSLIVNHMEIENNHGKSNDHQLRYEQYSRRQSLEPCTRSQRQQNLKDVERYKRLKEKYHSERKRRERYLRRSEPPCLLKKRHLSRKKREVSPKIHPKESNADSENQHLKTCVKVDSEKHKLKKKPNLKDEKRCKELNFKSSKIKKQCKGVGQFEQYLKKHLEDELDNIHTSRQVEFVGADQLSEGVSNTPSPPDLRDTCSPQHLKSLNFKTRENFSVEKISKMKGISETFNNSPLSTHYCDLCTFWFTKIEYIRHVNSNTHERIEELKSMLLNTNDAQSCASGGAHFKPPPNYCKICADWFSDTIRYDQHSKDKEHAIIEHFVNGLSLEEEKILINIINSQAYELFNSIPEQNFGTNTNFKKYADHSESDRNKELSRKEMRHLESGDRSKQSKEFNRGNKEYSKDERYEPSTMKKDYLRNAERFNQSRQPCLKIKHVERENLKSELKGKQHLKSNTELGGIKKLHLKRRWNTECEMSHVTEKRYLRNESDTEPHRVKNQHLRSKWNIESDLDSKTVSRPSKDKWDTESEKSRLTDNRHLKWKWDTESEMSRVSVNRFSKSKWDTDSEKSHGTENLHMTSKKDAESEKSDDSGNHFKTEKLKKLKEYLLKDDTCCFNCSLEEASKVLDIPLASKFRLEGYDYLEVGSTSETNTPYPREHYCELCDFSTDSPVRYDMHLKDEKHKKLRKAFNKKDGVSIDINARRTSGKSHPLQYNCELCDVFNRNPAEYDNHLKSEKHKMNKWFRFVMIQKNQS